MISTIFWPIDVNKPGFFYGWVNPVICVAGILPTHSVSEAKSMFEALQWPPCGSHPRILGRCTFTGHLSIQNLPLPELELDPGIANKYTLAYYYRHDQSSMRFYALGGPDISLHQERPSQYSPQNTQFKLDFTHSGTPRSVIGLNSTLISQFNEAKGLERLVHQRRPPNEAQTFLQRLLSSVCLHHAISPLAICGVFATDLILPVSNSVSDFCNTPILSFHYRLKDISATLKQLDVRAQQATFFINKSQLLWQRNSIKQSAFSAQYVNFYNTVWLVSNDIILGVALGACLCENHLLLSRMLVYAVDHALINGIQHILRWLDSWPAGLKLNTELSWFYSHTFIDLVAIWGRILQNGSPYMSSFIYLIGIISHSGLTLAIVNLLDLLGVLTAHIYVCYLISTAVYQQLLTTIGSLWNLFRGKRYNVLRNRIDSWNYEVDQLLFGTILFTLVTFLLPTVLIYYMFFALIHLCIMLLETCMETLLALMNNFSLFSLTLRIKDPWRLPGGIFFSMLESGPHNVLLIRNQPVAFALLFPQYGQLWSGLTSHYHPLQLMLCVFTGKHLSRYMYHYTTSDIVNVAMA